MPRLFLMATIFSVLIAVVLLAAGCEERIVSTRSRPATGMQDYKYTPVERHSQDKGLLEGVGDFLFGWTDGLFAEDPKPATRTVPKSQWSTTDWQTNTQGSN